MEQKECGLLCPPGKSMIIYRKPTERNELWARPDGGGVPLLLWQMANPSSCSSKASVGSRSEWLLYSELNSSSLVSPPFTEKIFYSLKRRSETLFFEVKGHWSREKLIFLLKKPSRILLQFNRIYEMFLEVMEF